MWITISSFDDEVKFDYGLNFTLESLNKYLNQNGAPTDVGHLQIVWPSGKKVDTCVD